MISKGADVNKKSSNTCLIYACNNENYDLVKLLLAKGANPNAKNSNGTTPLKRINRTLKSDSNNIELKKIAELLINYGAIE